MISPFQKVNGKLEAEFSFPDFKEALAFVNGVAVIAEEEKHHPDIFLTWGKVKVTLWTHEANQVTKLDYLLAERIFLWHSLSKKSQAQA
jgi:4a-hydroxytetrahydrobiopterin dehydratase